MAINYLRFWHNDENKAPDISNLPRGEFTWVPQPEYMLIKVDERLVAVGVTNERIKLHWQKKRDINYLNNPVDLAFAVTCHKFQGLPLDKIILSIGEHPTLTED